MAPRVPADPLERQPCGTVTTRFPGASNAIYECETFAVVAHKRVRMCPASAHGCTESTREITGRLGMISDGLHIEAGGPNLETPADMRVLTYNLQKGHTARKHLSFRGLGHAVAARAPDILFCQEVMHLHGDEDNQCSHLATALAHDHAFGPNAFYDHGCHGNATFTGHKLAEHKNHDVTHSRLEKRGILQTELVIKDQPILAFNVHFSLTARQRRLQWSQLIQLLDQADSRPVVICGDFNDWTGELDRTIARAGELQGALWHLPSAQRRTFPARRPLLALDRIYYRNLDLVDVSVLRGAPWSHLSDHLPLEASFKLVDDGST